MGTMQDIVAHVENEMEDEDVKLATELMKGYVKEHDTAKRVFANIEAKVKKYKAMDVKDFLQAHDITK